MGDKKVSSVIREPFDPTFFQHLPKATADRLDREADAVTSSSSIGDINVAILKTIEDLGLSGVIHFDFNDLRLSNKKLKQDLSKPFFAFLKELRAIRDKQK